MQPDDQLDETVHENNDASEKTRQPINGEATRAENGSTNLSELFLEALDLDPPQHPDSLGRLDNYEVLNVVGRGGMGIVARAFDEQLHRNVAIKVMSERLVTSENARKRFLREARAAASINHPNVVTIHAVNEHGRIPYLVMEYVEGVPLQERIGNDAPLSYDDVVHIGVQIAAGLAASERHGVVHRDVKPANIMLEDGIERVKITDFGLARLVVENSELTSPGDMLGTPSYMSPEQVDGVELGPSSDLFSLGCVLYAMFLGRSPFQASSSFASARRVKDYDPPLVSTIDPRVPGEFDELIQQLLSKDPSNRPPSAQAVADTLLDLSAATRMPTAESDTGASELLGTLPIRGRLPGWVVVTAVVCLIAAFGVLGGQYWKQQPARIVPINLADALADGELTVDPENGEFGTLSAALASCQRGRVIRLSPGRYQGPFELNSPKRFNGIRIVGQPGVVLIRGGDAPVLQVSGITGMTIENLDIQTRNYQNGICVYGDCPGLVIKNIHLRAIHPSESAVGLIRLNRGASGTKEQPIEIVDCHLNAGGVGIVIGSNIPSDPMLQNITIHHNTIAAASMKYGIPIVFQGNLTSVAVHHNWFRRGLGGVSVNLPTPQSASSVRLQYNTISEIDQAFYLNRSSPHQDLLIHGNLVVHGRSIHAIEGTPKDFRHWFSKNQWITHSESESEWVDPLFETVPESILASMKPGDDDYLYPSQSSPVPVMGRHAQANSQ